MTTIDYREIPYRQFPSKLDRILKALRHPLQSLGSVVIVGGAWALFVLVMVAVWPWQKKTPKIDGRYGKLWAKIEKLAADPETPTSVFDELLPLCREVDDGYRAAYPKKTIFPSLEDRVFGILYGRSVQADVPERRNT